VDAQANDGQQSVQDTTVGDTNPFGDTGPTQITSLTIQPQNPIVQVTITDGVVAAIDINPTPGTDPSHPAFYLPGQELNAGNLRGFWVVDPCKQNGIRASPATSAATASAATTPTAAAARAGVRSLHDRLRLLWWRNVDVVHQRSLRSEDAELS